MKKQLKILKKTSQTVSSLDDSAGNKSQGLVEPPMTEIFAIIKSKVFKADKVLTRNLSMLIHQVLKQFDLALEELSKSDQLITPDTVQNLAEILSLDIVDQNLF
jgi:hypothetical protein